MRRVIRRTSFAFVLFFRTFYTTMWIPVCRVFFLSRSKSPPGARDRMFVVTMDAKMVAHAWMSGVSSVVVVPRDSWALSASIKSQPRLIAMISLVLNLLTLTLHRFLWSFQLSLHCPVECWRLQGYAYFSVKPWSNGA